MYCTHLRCYIGVLSSKNDGDGVCGEDFQEVLSGRGGRCGEKVIGSGEVQQGILAEGFPAKESNDCGWVFTVGLEASKIGDKKGTLKMVGDRGGGALFADAI